MRHPYLSTYHRLRQQHKPDLVVSAGFEPTHCTLLAAQIADPSGTASLDWNTKSFRFLQFHIYTHCMNHQRLRNCACEEDNSSTASYKINYLIYWITKQPLFAPLSRSSLPGTTRRLFAISLPIRPLASDGTGRIHVHRFVLNNQVRRSVSARFRHRIHRILIRRFAPTLRKLITVLLRPDPGDDIARLRFEEARQTLAIPLFVFNVFVVFVSPVLFILIHVNGGSAAWRRPVRQEPVEEPPILGGALGGRYTHALHRRDGQWQHLARVEVAWWRGATAAHAVHDATATRGRHGFVEASLHHLWRDLAWPRILL